MKNALKRSLSILLAITIIFSSAYVGLSEIDFSGINFGRIFAIKVYAEGDNENNLEVIEDLPEAENEYIYYSELFYGYPYYLANDSYFKTYSDTINGIYNGVHESYQNSSLVIGTGFEHALDTITSPKDIATLITDTLGLTDFSYNDALDAANKEVVKHIISGSFYESASSLSGKTAGMVSKINTTVKYFNTFAPESNTGTQYTAEYYLQEAFDFLQDKGYLSFVSETILANLWVEINDSDFALKDCFKLAKTELEIAEAIMLGLLMEDTRLEIVDDILLTQNSETVLKQGMTRLKADLQGNFITYFINNYLVEELADELFEKVDDFVVDAIGGGEIKILIDIAKLAFDFAFEVPKFEDVLKWQVLICYSKDLANGIVNVANSFDDGPFLSDKIVVYEKLFVGYDAVNKAAMASTIAINKMQSPFDEAYDVLVEAAANNIQTVRITTKDKDFGISSSLTYDEFCKNLTNGVIDSSNGKPENLGEEIEISNGITSVRVYIKISAFANIMKGCINENSEAIYNFNDRYDGVSLFCEHINSVRTTILNTPTDKRITIPQEIYSSWTYSVSETIRLMEDSDTIVSNCIYGLNDTILGNIDVPRKSKLIIQESSNIKINGDIYIWRWGTLSNSGMLTINGNVEFEYESYFTNNNEVDIKGNLKHDGNNSIFTNNGTIKTYDCKIGGTTTLNTSDNSKLIVSGDFTGYPQLNGTIIFNGEEEQTVSGLNVNHIIVNNEQGLKYLSDTYVHGPYELNGNPLDCNGFTTNACTGTRFTDGNYGSITASDLTLYDSVEGDIFLPRKSKLIIPKNSNVEIQGNIYVSRWGSVSNSGELTIDGDVEFEYESYFTNNNEVDIKGNLKHNGNNSRLTNNGTIKTYDCDISGYINLNMSENSKLIVSGEFTGYQQLNGTVVLNGEEEQLISGLSVPVIIIDNESEFGVKFTSSIYPSLLFNHKGNVFSLTSGSKFVDYDGDGLKDNVDPEPTVGNPCTITIATENTEKGIVSETFASVGGTTVTVSAEPTFKYDFYCWKNASGKIVSYDADYSFVAKGDTTLTAYFTKRQRNIVVDTDNGSLTVPSKAEIESTVTVAPVENEGYIFVENSITVNGKAISGNSFVMPDEDVVISAQFCINNYYFALKDVLTEAKEIDQDLYSAETVNVLQSAIDNAQNSLVNDISQAESEARILELQSAMANLIFIKGSCGDSILWNYDEETKTLTITGTGEMYDYTDSNSPWEAFECEIKKVSIGRGITSIGDNAFNNCSVLTDVYYGYTEESWNTLLIGENNESLTSANIHYHTHNFIGFVTINPTCIEDGEMMYTCDCGDVYTESINALGHSYSTDWTIDLAATCTEDGSKSHHCTVCGDKTDVTVIVATGHNYEVTETLSVHPHTVTYICSYCNDEKTETPTIPDCIECIYGTETPIKGTENTKIDFNKFLIFTSIRNCSDIIEIISVSENATVEVIPSFKNGVTERYGTGTIVTVFDGDEFIGDFTLIVEGDTNGDSVCNVLDAFEAERASNGHIELEGAYAMAADSNSDDTIDINDYQAIVNKALAS